MEKKKQTFIEKACNIHRDKYDYSEINYINYHSTITIKCPIHGEFTVLPLQHLLKNRGCPSCRNMNNKHILGFGIFDYTFKGNSNKKSYQTWVDMLKRCYNKKTHQKSPTYIGCIVCDEWKYFSNFKEWFDENYVEDYQLDKDILVKGNKVYSPETCCFVPREINGMLTKTERKRGKYPIGVYYNKRRSKFISQIEVDNDKVFLGAYNNCDDAFKAYKEYKEKRIRDVSVLYFANNLIKENVYK